PGGSNLRKSAADLGVSAKGGHPEDRGGGLGCGRCVEGKRRGMTGGVSLSAGRCARRATEAGLGCGASWAEREGERARWAEVAGPAGRGWAALGWAREKGKGEVMGRTGLGFGFWAGFSIFSFYFFSISNPKQTKFEFK